MEIKLSMKSPYYHPEKKKKKSFRTVPRQKSAVKELKEF